jgi:hypothetical protein
MGGTFSHGVASQLGDMSFTGWSNGKRLGEVEIAQSERNVDGLCYLRMKDHEYLQENALPTMHMYKRLNPSTPVMC